MFVTGHAEYFPGNDIVCAGVSALVGALTHYAAESPRYRHVRCFTEKGKAFFACSDSVRESFDMIVEGLAAIASAYPDHVRVHHTVTE